MEEKEILEGASPQATENIETDKVGATIPDTEKDSAGRTVTVKFNKEIRELSYEEAAALAQKGMKYDSIAEDLSRLKELCGGKSLKEYIASLDKAAVSTDSGLDELRENFPQIKDEGDIPEAVLTAAEKEGGSLLDTYLRYRLSEERQAREAREKQQQNRETSVGSQRSSNEASNEINDEFIRGLWN